MTSHNSYVSHGVQAAAIAGAAAVVLVLAGCNSGDQPNVGTPSSTGTEAATQTATPTPTPTALYKPADATGPAENVPVPLIPEVAKTETKDGAKAFASYWFSVLSYAYETGDLALLKQITPGTCAACQESMESIRDWHSDGRWLTGGTIKTPAVYTASNKGAEGNYQVSVQAVQEPLSYVRADGTVVHSDANTSSTGNLLIVSFSDNSWVLHEVGRIVG